MIQDLVLEYRKKRLEGTFVDLVPVCEDFFSDVIRIRNQPKSKYFLNQGFDLTIDMQKSWYEDYLKRYDDLYWVVCDKKNNAIGTERIYDITLEKCEEGSTIIDENFSMKGPYAAETIMIALNFAFDVLGVKTVINTDRVDNKNINSISKKIGFICKKQIEIRGAAYNYYELSKENYNRKMLERIISMWSKITIARIPMYGGGYKHNIKILNYVTKSFNQKHWRLAA